MAPLGTLAHKAAATGAVSGSASGCVSLTRSSSSSLSTCAQMCPRARELKPVCVYGHGGGNLWALRCHC